MYLGGYCGTPRRLQKHFPPQTCIKIKIIGSRSFSACIEVVAHHLRCPVAALNKEDEASRYNKCWRIDT